MLEAVAAELKSGVGDNEDALEEIEEALNDLADAKEYVRSGELEVAKQKVSDANVPVTIIMPKALLEVPFVTLLNGNSITHSKYLENNTHTWIMVEPNDVDTLSLISGTVILGKKAVFKMKIVYYDQLIKWKVHDQNGVVLDQGEAKPLSFKR